MKKIFFVSLTALVCIGTSCTNKTATTTATTVTDSSVTMKEKNDMIYRAIETGDVSKLHDYIASDAVDHNGGPKGEDIRGGDSIIAMLGSMHNSFLPGLKMNVISQAVDGDNLFVLTEMDGTTTANPAMGMPPNTKMNSKSIDLIKIKDGKAVEHWAFMSMDDMMKMMKMDHSPMPADKKMKDTVIKK